MSPGPTFDRVYASLKEQLLSGRWAPGAHLEPAAIGDDLGASITPVRDALHRLVGEHLVDAPRHDGFWVPMLTETELRGLYGWNGDLVAWALRRQRLGGPPSEVAGEALEPGGLFLEIARRAGYVQLEHAIRTSGDRLAEYRLAEFDVLEGVAEELARIARSFREGSMGPLRGQVAAYHKRRQRAAPLILSTRRRTIATTGGH